jgi:hypothetical protein
MTVGISAAALYRSIEKWNPTLVIDECDELFADNPDLLRVVNSGWTPGSGVVRSNPDSHEPEVFKTFGPKAIAGKGKRMPDTMVSRIIFIHMKRRLRGEKIGHFRYLDDAGFARMRSQLARWALDHGEALGAALPEQPEGFINRTASNWQLLFAIADSLGAGARARIAAQKIAGMTDMASSGVMLLEDIRAIFRASTLDYVTSKNLIERLTADPEKPWAEWTRGRPITEKGVAGLLHEYGIVSRTVGPKGATAKGYRKADFEDAWQRYLDGDQKTPIFPSTRLTPSDDYAFAEKTPDDRTNGRREKIDGLSNEINTVDGSPGKMADSETSFVCSPWGPFSRWPEDGLELPPALLREVVPREVPLDRRPALGPEGDSLDDLV